MGPLYRIELLGHLCVRVGDRVLTRFSTQKTASLLAYLACHAGRMHARGSLVELLWPESDPDAGRNRLSTALWSLRRDLVAPERGSGRLLRAEREAVGMEAGLVEVDVARFDAEIARGESAKEPSERLGGLASALQRYTGPLLPDLHDGWVLDERQRLEEQFFRAADALIRRLEADGDHTRALAFAQHALSIDPLREEIAHGLMRLYVAAGRAAAALRAYRQLESRLREELGVAPADALAQLAEELVARRVVPTTSDAAARPTREAATGAARAAAPAEHLPRPLTRFFGREEELARLGALLRPEAPPSEPERLEASVSRLVTLTGPGGAGKTRLATEAAHRLAPAFDGDVWFVPLADLATATLLARALLDAITTTPAPDIPALDQVVEALSGRASLLVLDNFEQLLPEGRAVLQTLLARAPRLCCLVTSRRRLDVDGEQVVALAPLPLDPAVQLFLDRARSIRPELAVDEDVIEAVTGLCRRLDGVPLALELAAARTAVMSPPEILASLGSRLDLPARRHDTDERHRALRTTFEWGFHLVPAAARHYFTRLSICRGSWTLADAIAVCEEPKALEYLEELQACSLVTVVEPPATVPVEQRPTITRFRMLEVLREFAAAKLRPAARQTLARRHATHYLALAEDPDRPDGAWLTWQARMLLDQENLRAALDWSLVHEPRIALRLAIALGPFWRHAGHTSEGQAAIESALARAHDAPAELRTTALQRSGALALSAGDYALGRERLAIALTLARELADGRRIAEVLHLIGWVARFQGDYPAAESAVRESLAFRRATDDESGLASSLNLHAAILGDRGDFDAARAALSEALDLYRRRSARGGIAACLHDLGILAYREGDDDGALAFFEESLTIHRERGDEPPTRFALAHLGHALCRLGEPDAARAVLTEALSLCRRLHDRRIAARCLEGFAALAAPTDPRRATRLLAAALALRDTLGFVRAPIDQPEIDALRDSLRRALGDGPFTAAWEAGRALGWPRAGDEAVGG